MGHTCKNGSLFEKLVTSGTMRKKWATLKKRVTLGKMVLTWKTGSNLKKLVKHGKKMTIGRKVHT